MANATSTTTKHFDHVKVDVQTDYVTITIPRDQALPVPDGKKMQPIARSKGCLSFGDVLLRLDAWQRPA